MPNTLAPDKIHHSVNQDPLNPVCPVIITFLFNKYFLKSDMYLLKLIYSINSLVPEPRDLGNLISLLKLKFKFHIL